MKRKDPLKNLTNQTRANVSFLMMSSPNGTISSNVALNRRKLRKLFFYTLHNPDFCLIFPVYFFVFVFHRCMRRPSCNRVDSWNFGIIIKRLCIVFCPGTKYQSLFFHIHRYTSNLLISCCRRSRNFAACAPSI